MRNSILVGLAVLAMVGSVQASVPTLSIDYLLVDGKAIKTDGTLKEAYWFGGGQTDPITAFGITWAYLDAFDNSPPEGSGSLDHNGAAFTGNELLFVRDVPNCNFSNITGTWTGLTIGAEYRAQFILNQDHPSRMCHAIVGTTETGDVYGYTTPLIYTFDWIADSTSINWLFGGSSGKAAGYDLFQLGQAPQLTTTHANTSTIDLGSSIALSTPVTDTTLTLGNSGVGTIAVSAPGISGGDAGLFSIIPSTGTSLVGPAGTQNYSITFAGSGTPGTYTTSLAIATDAGNLSYTLSATVAASWPDYLPGDFNKDGQVGPEDFGILKDQFGNSNLAHGNHESWTLGDANDDGQIGPEDFGLLKDSFGLSNGPTGTYPLTNVPEPATLSLLALGGLAALRRRRK